MMSGTSLDGVDACIVDIDNNFNFKILETHSLDYHSEIRQKLLDTANNKTTALEICNLNFVVGKVFAQCAEELIKKAGLEAKNIDLIASHGQTIFHIPEPIVTGNISTTSTLQIGNISVIAELTGIKTVGDFRSRDMAANGQGAPLVPFADELIFKKEIPRAIQNIGGIGNVTVLSKDCDTFAFDTGAGNMLIDYFTKKLFDKPFDKDGEIALSGNVDEVWLNELLNEPYYSKTPPKSTGRELFNEDYAQKIFESAPEQKEDVIATLTALTAQSIKMAYEDFVFPKTQIKEIVLGGGGAYNKALAGMLEKSFDNIKIKKHSDFGINDKFKEALAFAMLGFCTVKKIPNNLSLCTGAEKSVIMGVVAE